MSSKKGNKTKQQKAKKGAKPEAKATADQAQVTPAEATQDAITPTADQATQTAEQSSSLEQPTAAEPPTSTTLVWPQQPTTHETDVANYHLWTTTCGRYRIVRVVNKFNGGGAHFNAEVKNGDGGYHSIEQSKDGCG